MSIARMSRIMILCVLVLWTTYGIIGCGGDEGLDPFSSEDGTGVRGLDTPDEILSNPYVEDILDEARDEGLNITPEQGLDPPVISGTYDIGGTQYIPSQGTLASGTWRWSNQTSNNHIDTDYSQDFQTGSNVEGEIIRGSGNRFTVYSVLDVTSNGHVDRAIVLVDGEQDNQGNIEAIYIGAPVESDSYIVPSAGYLELTLTGIAKISADKRLGALLINHIIETSNHNRE